MKYEKIFGKLHKNVVTPLGYIFKSLRNNMPVASINIGMMSDSTVFEWAKNLGVGEYFALKKIANRIGPALIMISKYNSFQSYSEYYNGKASISYYNRLCLRKGYSFVELNRNDYVEDIFEINTSTTFRQGKRMAPSYCQKIEKYDNEHLNVYYGVVSESGKLVAYANTVELTEVVIIYKILGHNDFLKDKIMYFMIFNIIKNIYENRLKTRPALRYIMYDSYFMNSEGLKFFKEKCGFEAYRINWKFESGK